LAGAVLLTLLVITDGNIETTSMRCFDLNMSRRLKFSLLFFISLSLCSCTGYHLKTTQPKGIYHRVKSGDTLWNIARAYKVNIQDLAEANNITNANMIEEGSVVFIPDANHIVEDVMTSVDRAAPTGENVQKEKRPSPVRLPKEEQKVVKLPLKPESPSLKDSSKDQQRLPPRTPASGDMNVSINAKSESEGGVAGMKDKEAVHRTNSKVLPKQDLEKKVEKAKQRDNGEESEKIKFDRDRFIWPVKGKVRSKFGIQPNGMYYNGIRISAKEGASVLAAAGGTVIFAAPLKDYGESVIIKHEDNYATVYTHLYRRMVKVDDHVKKGGLIAFLGQSDRMGEAYINFEIRYKNKARNPLFFLP
jgi:lipoprotein NlpD